MADRLPPTHYVTKYGVPGFLAIIGIPFLTQSRTLRREIVLAWSLNVFILGARNLGLKPTFFWYPSSRSFFRFLANLDIGCLPSAPTLSRRLGPPVKMYDYMSVGLPCVANRVNGWTDIIRKESIGLLTEDDPKDYADAMISLLDDPDEAQRMGARAIRLVEERYNWENSVKELVTLLEKLCHNQP